MSPSSAMPPPSYVPSDPLPGTLVPSSHGLGASLRPSVSWQAVFAGAVIAIAVELLLAVLGLAVGLDVASPAPGANPGAAGGPSGVGLAAGIWWVVSSAISLLLGGYAGARLANVPTRFDGLLQGLVIWGVAVLVSVWVLSAAATGLVHGVVNALGGTISAVGHGFEATAPQVAAAFGTATGQEQGQGQGQAQGQVLDQARLLFEPPNPQQMPRDQAVQAVALAAPDLLVGGDKAAAAKARIAPIIAAQLNISQQDAEKRVDEFQQRLEQTKTQAAQTAKNVVSESAGIASDAAFAIFVALVVTAVAGALGGSMARPRRQLRADFERWIP